MHSSKETPNLSNAKLPVQLVRLFVNATPEVIAAAPTIGRLCYTIYMFLGITMLSVYYLQSMMRDGLSLLIAILRSAVVSSLFIFMFPVFLGINGVWIALPYSELFVSMIALWVIYKSNQQV